jgi:hypothetical protein
MGWTFDRIGHLIAGLQSRAEHCGRFTPDDSTARSFNCKDMYWADLREARAA